MLIKEEKQAIVETRIRNAEANKLNLELDIIQEQAKSNPETNKISKLELEIADTDLQIAALNNILNSL